MERRLSHLTLILFATILGNARVARGVSCVGKPDGTSCDSGSDGASTMVCETDVCVPCTTNVSASPRFVDNGDGTITDRKTCLVWEKKDNAGGIHDLNNVYDWNGEFSVFLPLLNGPGFAGHQDWRIPTAAGRPGSLTGEDAEIESIQASPSGCGGTPGGGCIAAAFDTNCGPYDNGALPDDEPPYVTGNSGCTVDGVSSCSCTPPSHYWSASNSNAGSGAAWLMCYTVAAPTNGLSSPATTEQHLARAVRGGPAAVVATATAVPELSGQALLVFVALVSGVAWWRRGRLAGLLAAAHTARSNRRSPRSR